MADEREQREDGRFSQYLESERPLDRFLQNPDEDDDSLLGTMALRVAQATAIGFIAHRTGAVRRLARFLDTHGRGTLQAAREILNEEGSLFHNMNMERARDLARRFNERRKDRVQEQVDRIHDFAKRREYDIERYLRQLNHTLDQHLPFVHEEGLRIRNVLRDLRNEGLSETHLAQIEKAFRHGETGFLRFHEDEQIKSLLRTHGVTDQDVLDMVLRARARNRGNIVEADTWTRAYREALRQKAAEDVEGYTKPRWNQGWRNWMAGHRQATVEDVLKLHSSGRLQIDADLHAQLQDMIRRNQKFKDQIFDENLYVKTNRHGEITDFYDYKVFDELKRHTMEAMATTVPGGLLHLRDILNIREAKEVGSIRIMPRGARHQSLNAQMGVDIDETLNRELIFINGKVYDLFDHNVVNGAGQLDRLNKKRDLYATSSRFGTIAKIHRSVGGIMTPEDKRPKNRLMRFLDIGGQDRDAKFPKAWSIVSKTWNPDWERNIINNALDKGVDYDQLFQVRQYFEKYSKGLSARTLNNLKSELPAHLREFIDQNNINFSKQEDMMKLFQYFGEGEGRRYASASIQQLWRKYQRDPDMFLYAKTPIGESTFLVGEYTNVQTGYDRLRRDVSLELIRQITEVKPRIYGSDPYDFRKTINDLYESGKILKEDVQEAQFLYSHYQFRQASQSIYTNREIALGHVNQLLTGSSEEAKAFQEDVRKAAKRNNPWTEKFTGTRPPNQVNDEFIYVNKAIDNWRDLFDIKDIARQMGFRTGRRNMEDFTTLSIFGVHYPVYRLQDALGDLWLGFSDASMDSPLQMWSSLFLKRFLPLYAGYEAWNYIDDATGQYTGRSISERWETHKAWQALDDARYRDEHGLNEYLQHKRALYPGLDHWKEMPEIHLPLVGEVGPGHLLSALFMVDAPLDEKDTYSEEQLLKYYQEGTDPVRKNRWWFLGSKSAYRGDRIIEFAPNDLRLAASDWENSNTDLTYEERYGEMNWLPTLENPLGIFKRILGLTDPYYWEKKHYYDRPYLLTGSMFNPNTMAFGDIGNATIGQLVKPTRRMHPEYWGDPVLVQEQADQYGERPTEPIVTRVSPGGRREYVVKATPSDYGSDEVVYTNENQETFAEAKQMFVQQYGSAPVYMKIQEKDENGKETGAFIAQDVNTGEVIYVPASIAKEGYTYEQLFSMAQAPEPTIDTKPRAMFDEEFTYRQEIVNRKLRALNDPRSLNWRAQEALENWREPLGVYNWIMGDEVLGYDPYTGKEVIQKADAAYNLSNRFWEMNLGGFGGQLSEIGRRFVRRDDGKLEQYNPIRNTMPDWLPGGDYFINFLEGDPYSKIPHGEYRLPGEAYEKLNELHPDETGRYGAFDKFKILADVAPWSDEYRFWRDYVTEYIDDPELRKQIAQIKRQVAQRKKKYEFTEYRFKYADLEKHKVTVTKILDDYTFLTKEFGDTPIRLAGVDVHGKAEGVLQSYIQVGDTITIGLDADHSRQISDDTYGTAHAVVFKNQTNINQDILRRGLMKENKTDFSATGVWARFTPDEIAEGRRWETIAHAESPLNTKFLQVRTALEEYERDQIYGKDYATWRDFLTTDYLIPTFQQAIRHNFFWSVFDMGTAGAVLMATLGGGGRKRTLAGAIIGGVLGGMGNLYRHYYEYKTGETWIPERRRLENEVNEYFDILQYMKYTGLYEEAKREAAEMGYDVEAIAEAIDIKKMETKEARKQLEALKKQLYLEQPKGWEEQKKEINKQLDEISLDWNELILPDVVLQALQYKEKAETTLYAINPYDDRMKVARAFPYKDRWFFEAFVNAPERDRERILELVPENERRIYKALWGYGDEPVKPLEYYFNKYYLPGPDWAGWRPDFNLEDIKVKVVRNLGLDMNDFNFWDDDVEASKYAPDLSERGNNIHQPNSFRGFRDMQQTIQAILEGQGLYDVRVTVTPNNGQSTRIHLNYEEDRSAEIENYIKNNMQSLV
jgi:uncharacterized protein (UPF0335 family)